MKKIENWFIGAYLVSTPDIFAKVKIRLTYNFSLFFALLSALYYGNLIINDLWYHFAVISYACISIFSVPFILKFKKDHLWAANWFAFHLTISTLISYVIQEFNVGLSGPLWSMTFVAYLILIFGGKGGLIRSIPLLILTLLFLIFSFTTVRPDFGIPEDQQIDNHAMIALIPILAGVFIISLFSNTSLKASRLILKQKEIVEIKNKAILDSINYARRIQSAILPPSTIIAEYFKKAFIMYKPKDVVAGDFYWMTKLNDTILFAAADCTGHGVPGAMVSVICSNGLNRSVAEYGLTEPGEILDRTKELVLDEFIKEHEISDGMDIALCSLEGHHLKYAGAHIPLWIVRKGELIEYKADKQPIGRFHRSNKFKTHEISLQSGDCLYIFSDGYADQFGGPNGKKYMRRQLKEVLLKISEKPIHEQKELIEKSFEEWKGAETQVDDVCFIGVQV